MAEMGNSYSLADLGAVLGNKDGMFGGNGASWIVMLLIFFLFFRNGGNGFGGDFGTVPTQAATQDSVRNVLSNIETSKILDAIQGNAGAISQLAQSTGIGFSEMQNALGNVRTTILETANATNLSVKDLATQAAMGNANILSALQNCCCTVGQKIDAVGNQLGVTMLQGFNGVDKTLCDIRYANEKNTSAIIASGTANTERILDYLNQTKLDELNRELSLARAEISQKDQTAAIVAQLKNSCGCGCGCGNSCNC